MMPSVKSVVVMAGGTGGHVFPALAVAEALRAQGVRIHWLGTRAGIEADLVPAHGFDITYLDVSGVRGQGLVRLLMAPFKIARSVIAAMRTLKVVKADCVIGLGGYVTGPGGVAARLLGKPLIIHEQNAVAGFTNRQLSRMATRVLEAFPSAFPASEKVQCVGNPVRIDIAALPVPDARFAERNGALRVLVMGGSQGAVALNELVPEALSLLAGQMPIEIRHQAGKKNTEKAVAQYRGLGLKADVLPFIDDMAAMYGWADLAICRSGALTVSELAAAGVASVLIPYPFAVDDHQTANGRYLSDAGAALLISQKELTAEKLARELQPLMNRDALLSMARKARAKAQPESTDTVVAACLRGGK
ncbi:MAG: undecaprenyldiphospho-muramoylpentapeptide beta-N-acetylglucosaminyltransferase [Moraxellaceae bacterium]|jgi:UDP-N-acetylglucosamine--N-acetylmuramyl-(pentapeptide) pyrophosphoryl-undecaprenol N-acetylglucosamine transferase|nr:undecaprenyldiphospho-muramoylpentapeptide beta-N-acetylglucosaminyltransferase [Moraxellaceae bacterium]MBP7229613.1 undecaprenyldiphospho-muramoylpentapeptide beta-N-acetylglucosaminyltransferase [Moraxellaceae bacterium]MBP8851660.1 undecaprenyldiphospho-muramoylpentapeptide beta-N-acetylglucosaminyltransferase [Moraxellaceae bacterium]MBP9045556.1 undecaprenyldiphospho-muramoylpentapeptide beta-N-acetylglucosaminyltransferase [Moraxellaceae bacterium]MBP9729974.1 undecaprenyldiphospho-mu